jgi:hypothetical protein
MEWKRIAVFFMVLFVLSCAVNLFVIRQYRKDLTEVTDSVMACTIALLQERQR